jgi:hypothetical protein
MNMQGFQDIFDPPFEEFGDLLFQGKILAEVYRGSTESMPFIGRMNDMACPILTIKRSQYVFKHKMKLTNVIESPVLVRRWGAEIYGTVPIKKQVLSVQAYLSCSVLENRLNLTLISIRLLLETKFCPDLINIS